MIRLIRKSISNWKAASSQRRLYRAYPELAHFDAAEREAIRRHGRVSDIRAARQEAMTALLRAK